MLYISSKHPINNDAIEDELLSPPELKSELLNNGLAGVEITIEEFTLAEKYGTQYIKLSTYDRIALAIVKNGGISLLTGDLALRRAAKIQWINCSITKSGINTAYPKASKVNER